MNKFVPTDQIADRFGDLPRGRADVLEQIEALQHQRPDMKFPVVQIGDQLYVCNPNSFPYSWPTNRSDELGEKKKEVHKAIVARLQVGLVVFLVPLGNSFTPSSVADALFVLTK